MSEKVVVWLCVVCNCITRCKTSS